MFVIMIPFTALSFTDKDFGFNIGNKVEARDKAKK
jgi:hypothetical protein